MCGKPHEKSSITGRQSLSSPIFHRIRPLKQFFPCLDLTFQQCPPYDSSSHQPLASYSQWSSRYRPAIIWTGDRGGDGVSIELPLVALRTNPPNGEAVCWLTTSIDSPARPPLSHLFHLFLIPVACSALYPPLFTLSLFIPPLSLQLLFFSYECTFMYVKMDGYFSFNISLQKQSLMVINATCYGLGFKYKLIFKKKKGEAEGSWFIEEVDHSSLLLGLQFCQTYSAQRAGLSSSFISSPLLLFSSLLPQALFY